MRNVDERTRRRWVTPVCAALLVVAGCGGGSDEPAGDQAAQELELMRCGAVPDLLGQLDCYNDAFAEVRADEGVEAALDQVVAWHNDPRSGPFSNHCHEVLHTLGEDAMGAAGAVQDDRVGVFAFAEVTCTSGFVHGALTRYLEDFDRARLDSELESVCPDLVDAVSDAIGVDADPTGWLSWNCDHMIGHAVYWTHTDDLVAGAAWCTRFDDDSLARVGCEAGYFMEYFLEVGRSPKDGLLASPSSPDDVHELCRLVDPAVASGCWSESGGVLYITSGRSWVEAGENCRALAPGEELLRACYEGLARNIAPYAGFEPDQMRAWCAEVGDAFARDTCSTQIAGAMAVELAMPAEGLAICAADITDPTRRAECERLVNGADAQLTGSGFGGGVGYAD